MVGNTQRAWFAALALALWLPGSVVAQSRPSLDTLDARLARVERVLDQSLLGQLQRIDALQEELRELRGELERLDNAFARLDRRSDDLYTDTDRRVTELEAAQEAGELFGGPGLPGLPGAGGGLDETLLEGDIDGAGTGLDETASESVGRFVGGGSRAADAGEPIQVRATATQAEKAAYTQGYDLLAQGDNDAAVASFDEFLATYPDGPYSFNAWYWKGEAMYAERRFDEAIENFRVVTESFPTSTKVPDAQLKIGFALYEQGDFATARGVLESVRDSFPGRSASVLARKRLQKMDREGV